MPTLNRPPPTTTVEEASAERGGLWTEGQAKVLAADCLDGIERALFQHSSA